MPDQSTILSLPHILPSQAQKHVTHNEALRLLDVMVQLTVLQRTLSGPPASPGLGDRHIVASGPTGDWNGHAQKIAMWNGSAWEFFGAVAGWRAYVVDESAMAVFDGAGWQSLGGGVTQVAQWGVGMAADATNKLAVESAAALFTNPTGSHQLAINKGAAAATSSLLFQHDFDTHAEIGLIGDNDLTVKVSPDGAAFITALSVAKNTGRVALAQPVQIVPMAGDAGSLSDGYLWYNSTTGKFRARQNGATVDVVTEVSGTFPDSDFTISADLDATKKAMFQVSGLTTGTTRTYSLPNASGTVALLSGTQTFTGTTTISGTATLSGTTTISAATANLGTSAAASTLGLGTGATTSGINKTINIGTAGLSGSVTSVIIGSAVSGALGSVTINSPAVTVVGQISGTAVTQTATDVTAGRLLKVGDFGLGGTGLSLTDIDDPTTRVGFYRITTASIGTFPPVAGKSATLLHQGHSVGYLSQRYQDINTDKIYVRYYNGTWSTWRLVYNHNTILGTVSQASGVPTGALIERGSNANGEYARFADGTQICTSPVFVADATTVQGALFKWASDQTWTFPASFISTPVVTPGRTNSSLFVAAPSSSTTTSATVNVLSTVSLTSRSAMLAAFGRWF
jgi:hypothetical protein